MFKSRALDTSCESSIAFSSTEDPFQLRRKTKFTYSKHWFVWPALNLVSGCESGRNIYIYIYIYTMICRRIKGAGGRICAIYTCSELSIYIILNCGDWRGKYIGWSAPTSGFNAHSIHIHSLPNQSALSASTSETWTRCSCITKTELVAYLLI